MKSSRILKPSTAQVKAVIEGAAANNTLPVVQDPRLMDAIGALAEAELKRRARNKIATYYPPEGPLRRDLYGPHMDFFSAGSKYRTRIFMAGNRCGKTVAGAYEMTVHLTGQYPSWWVGRRFTSAIKAVAASDTAKTTREVIQYELIGPCASPGTGLIPGDTIQRLTTKAGVADAFDTLYVKHVSGGTSILILKSYDQKRESFQGLSLHAAWMDEEMGEDIFDEVMMRTATTGGLVWLSFTPLQGITPLVQRFLPNGKIPS